jgi:hypothetical protein
VRTPLNLSVTSVMKAKFPAGVENIADHGTIGPRKILCWQKEKKGKEEKGGKKEKKERKERKK